MVNAMSPTGNFGKTMKEISSKNNARLPSRRRALFYFPILKYLYTVGLLTPHTRASSLTFIFPAA